MIKRLLSRAVPEHEWPVWAVPLAVLAGFALSGLLFYAAYFGPGVRDLQGISYSPTDDPARVRVEVGGTLFAVPAHYTRNGQTRRGAELTHAELHALLPELTPWQKADGEAFLNADADAKWVSVTLRAMNRNLPEAEIFDALYKPYIAGAGVVRDDRLQAFRFRSDSPYASKEILRGLTAGSKDQRDAAPMFICDLPDKPSPACESRFDIGNTAQASYRFKRAYLSDWAVTDRRLKDLIRNFRAAARSISQR